MADVSNVSNPDAYLTNYSYALMQDSTTFVAGAASSRITVTQESGKFKSVSAVPTRHTRGEVAVKCWGVARR